MPSSSTRRPTSASHPPFPTPLLDLLRNPLADGEDPVHASPATLHRRADEMSTVMALLEEAEDQYFRAQEQHDGTELASERVEFALTKAWITFGAARIQLYAALAATPPDPGAKAAWSAANAAYRDVCLWADIHLDPPSARTCNCSIWPCGGCVCDESKRIGLLRGIGVGRWIWGRRCGWWGVG